jgi:hypothetical protein
LAKFDNKQKKLVRRGLSGVGVFLFFFSILVYAGIELPYFNHFNPLYNSYYYILFGFVVFISRGFLKDAKRIGNYIDFFGRSGLVVASYEIPFENISPTRANFVDKEGEKKGIRHTHPFVIPSEDEWSNEYLVPSNGLESLNPSKLVEKYGAKINLSDNEKATLLALESKIPEIAALDPQVLHTEMVEADTVDSLNQEAAYQVSEIRKGWFSGAKTGQILMYVLLGIMVGGMAFTLAYMAGKVDFSHIAGG